MSRREEKLIGSGGSRPIDGSRQKAALKKIREASLEEAKEELAKKVEEAATKEAEKEAAGWIKRNKKLALATAGTGLDAGLGYMAYQKRKTGRNGQ